MVPVLVAMIVPGVVQVMHSLKVVPAEVNQVMTGDEAGLPHHLGRPAGKASSVCLTLH